jgi:hypothetical protein
VKPFDALAASNMLAADPMADPGTIAEAQNSFCRLETILARPALPP